MILSIKRLLEKIYTWDEKTKIGHTLMDKPMPEQKYQNAAFYKNKWKHGPFLTKEEWIDWAIRQDQRINFTMPKADVIMHNLLDFQKIYLFLKKIANSLNSSIDFEKLKMLHNYWLTRF